MPERSPTWSTSAPGGSYRRGFSVWDLLAGAIVLGVISLLASASRELLAPLALLDLNPVTLDPSALPGYAARTTLRMLAAMLVSLAFTFTYATLAAKSRRVERLLIPLLDILQSVPILGFISVTVVFFMSLAPGRVLGAEFAAMFAIFTSQAWNMAFSFYQSLRTVPVDLAEAARSLRLSAWMRFWRLEVPFAMPALIWNMMVSMSGSWFFIVAAEAISVGTTTVTLPGIGSYIALAIQERNVGAVLWAIAAMSIVIMLYDQLVFRPLVAWADRFRAEQQTGVEPPSSWVLDVFRRSHLVARVIASWSEIRWPSWRLSGNGSGPPAPLANLLIPRAAAYVWLGAIVIAGLFGTWHFLRMLVASLGLDEIRLAVLLALITMLRVIVLLALCSVIWIPIGVWIGLRPRATRLVQPIAQLLAAFPVNLLFPLVVLGIVHFRLNPDLWLSPLMVLGTQWYILFNVIAGAAALPSELRDISSNLGIHGWLWWSRVALPGIFPYFVTGAITASGGSLNASIVAEAVSWGDTHLNAHGIGAYIANATAKGDFPRIALGIAVMSAFVILLNRLLWRPLFAYSERRFRFD
ncbi:MAG: ABC transporter permease subunit [Proteobacteria bacterium]|nr:ABC transporter permease subunit [Pseudomonadota bacterium]